MNTGCTVEEAGIFTEVETVLVLTRTTSERITIGDNITVMVVEIRGDKVRLGIEAPAEVPVVRDDAITRTKKRGRNHPAERTAT